MKIVMTFEEANNFYLKKRRRNLHYTPSYSSSLETSSFFQRIKGHLRVRLFEITENIKEGNQTN